MYIKPVVGTMALSAILIASACGGGAENGTNVREAEKIAVDTRASGPMPEGSFKATITANVPGKMKPREKVTLTVKVKNISNTTWPSHGRAADGFFQVNLGNFWFDASNKRIEKNAYVRSGMPRDLKPGEEVEIPLAITAPDKPGDYTLELDMVQEMTTWFSEKGSITPKFKVTVGG
jgi:hypothetical protein